MTKTNAQCNVALILNIVIFGLSYLLGGLVDLKKTSTAGQQEILLKSFIIYIYDISSLHSAVLVVVL
jgi:hypothetical protein